MVKKGKKIPQRGNAQSNKTDKHFGEGYLVAAKVKGYPPWPGRVESVANNGKQLKYTVRFFATNDIANLLPEAIVLFKDFTPKPSDLKRKSYQEAFRLCQDEYDSQLAAKDRECDSSPAPSLETPSPEAQSTQSGTQSAQSEHSTLPKITAELELPATTTSSVPSQNDPLFPVELDSTSKAKSPIKSKRIDASEGKKESTEQKSSVKLKSEKALPQKAKGKVVSRSPTKLDTRTDDNNTVLPKIEQEDSKSRDLTIKKLQSKLDAKLKEKARMKQEETEKRILKSSATLVRINKKLAKFLKILQELNLINSEKQSDSNEWAVSVKEFESIHEALVKCIVFLSKKRRSDDLKACRDILTDLVFGLRSAKKNDKLPQITQDKIKSCLRLTRKTHQIKDLINMPDDQFQKQENAMIERKENSVEH